MFPISYFEARSVADSNGCWLWQLHRNKQGYGQTQYKKRSYLAHRAAYESVYGAVPDGMTVDHRCFTEPCVNPVHLRLLTLLENQRNQRSAMKTHCVNGHEYTPANTYLRKGLRGRRDCRTCIVQRVKKYQTKRAAA